MPSSEGFIRQGATCRDEKPTDLYVHVCVDRLDGGHICFTLPHHVTCTAEKLWDKNEVLITKRCEI